MLKTSFLKWKFENVITRTSVVVFLYALELCSLVEQTGGNMNYLRLMNDDA